MVLLVVKSYQNVVGVEPSTMRKLHVQRLVKHATSVVN